MSSTTPSQSSSKYVDYDEFVDYQLEKTRGEIKWNDVLTTLAGIAALTLAYLFVFTLFDHWVIEGGFSRGTRAVLLTLLVTVSLGWTVWKILLPWWRKVHLLFAARMIEEHVPGLRSNLLNLIDLEAAGRKPHPGIQQAMEKRSAVELSKVDMEHVIDRRQLLRICYVLLTVVVLFCLYALFSPKPISFLRPLTVANIPVATQTRIVEVTPGDASVLARRSLPVSVIVRDKKPDRVLFHYTTEDQSFVDEQLQMQANEEKEGEYLLLFAGENGDGIGQRTTYYITAGDARSETFTIDVEKVPTAVIDRIEYRYPEYMDFEPRSQVIGAIDAWEGTEVVLEARIGNDVPVRTAVVQFVDPNQTAAGYEEVPLTVIDGNRLRGAWKLQFREDGTYAREYRIVCKSEEGLSEDDPPTYPITIRPDEAPEVGFVDPTGDIERAANAVVPLVYKARDPDFQLRYITLRVERRGEELQSYPLFDGEQKAVADRYRWELKPLGLKPGDVVTFALEARDNKQPFGNRRTSQPLKLTISAPVEPEQVEQQLQQDEAEQEPRLEDEQQAAAEENGEQGGASESEEEGDESSEEDAGVSDREKSQEGENEGASDEEQENENSGEDGKQTGEQPDAANENTGDKPQPTDDGMGEESEQPEVGEEAGEEGGEPNALKNDGTDDAEVLEKIIEEQQENNNQAPGDSENADQQNNTTEGTGNESPTNEPSDDPSQQGTGNGTQKQDDQKSEAQNNSDNNSENNTDSEPGEPSDGTTNQKRPGDPDTKGTGTPDEKTDPEDATKASDPNNIDRKEGTDPKTTSSSDPRDPNAPQEQTDQPPKNPSNAGEEKGNPNSPGPKTQPEGPDRPDPAEGDPKGQRSKKPDSGETGSSQQTSDGQQGGSEPGNGETTDNPGDSAEGEGGKERSGGEPGDPKSSQKESGEGKAGGKESSGGEGEGGEGSAEGGSGKGDKPSTGELGEGSGTGTGQAPGTSGGGGTGQEGNVPGSGEGSSSSSAEEQNLEHAKQAADLVLKRLEQQLERGEVSEDLLKELGWTEGEMKSFVDRMRQQLSQNRDELTVEEAVRQRQFEEMLKNMNFSPKKEAARTNDSRPGKATRSFSGRNLPVPIEYRDAYEEFTRDLGRKK